MMLLKRCQGFLPRSQFVRSVGLLASGTVIGQLILILTTPLLTRLYTPKQFGVLAVFSGLMSTITVVACLRFEMAIPLPRRNGAAFQVVGLALVSLALITLIVALMGFGPGQELLKSTGTPELVSYYWLLPIGIFLGGAYQLSSLWATRRKAFTVLAKTKVQQGLGGAATQIGLGLLKTGPLGLILGQIVGQALGLVRLSLNTLQDYNRQNVQVSQSGMKWAFRRYHRFLKFDALASLFNTASSQVPAILFSAYFSPALAGAYLLSVRILSAPMTLIGKTMMQVLLPDMVAARYSGMLPSKIKALQKLLTVIGLGPFFVIALLSPIGFGYIFGSRWSDAGGVAAWTALWVGFQFIYSPLSVVLLAVEAQKTNLVLQLALFFSRLVVIYLGYKYHQATLAIILFSLVSVVHYMIGNVVIGWRAGLLFHSAILEVSSSVLQALIIPVPVLIALFWGVSKPFFVFAIVLSIVLWLVQLKSINDSLKHNNF